jgi:hypothetical protein
MRRLLLLIGLGVLVAPGHFLASQALPRDDADAMAAKVQTIYVRGTLPPLPDQPAPAIRTAFTQQEANAYFQHYGPEFLPQGLVDPRVTIGDGNRVAARAIVDLGRVRTAEARGWLDPLAYITGSLEVTLAGKLYAANKVGVIQFESATIGGVSVSEAVLQELITYYTVTPESPRGFSLGEPFELPSNITAVELKSGAATVVQ